jgi:hypothetical protein
VTRLFSHVFHLPSESAFYHELDAWWTPELELLATIGELVHATFRAQLGSGGVKRGRIPKPFEVRRPRPRQPSDVESTPTTTRPPTRPERRKATSVAEVIAVLNAGHRRR